jgi:AcrR family transcriptional regulator
MKERKVMQISELARITGVPASTIRYYVREGLIPQPIRTGKTRAYYRQDHLKAIELIKKRQATGRKSLQVIRREVEKRMSQKNMVSIISIPPSHKDKIISSATELFSSKGYAETSIDDIASHARMSKETFYAHFRNKEELFMECADKVFHDMYREVWQIIRDEKDVSKRASIRTSAFFASYPKWIIMMNLVRGLSVGNPAFKEKFKKLLKQMITPISKEYKVFNRDGLYARNIDSTMYGYFTMGMAEYGALLISRGLSTEQEVNKYLDRIISHGV